jgi:hypothetical protein
MQVFILRAATFERLGQIARVAPTCVVDVRRRIRHREKLVGKTESAPREMNL